MMNSISNKLEKSVKRYQIKFLITASVFVIISQIIIYLKISYAIITSFALLVVAVSIFWASILPPLACPKYKGSYNFVMGSFLGLMISLAPALVVRELYSSNLWIGVLIICWASGGYLSVRDKVMQSDEVLDSPLATGFAILGIFMGSLLGLLILSLVLAMMFSIFLVSLPFLYTVIISFIIINVSLVEYLSKKVFSKDLEKIEYKPNTRGVFGAFLGGLNGLMWSFLIGFFYSYLINISMNTFWIASYFGMVAGIVLGFFFGYQVEKNSQSP